MPAHRVTIAIAQSRIGLHPNPHTHFSHLTFRPEGSETRKPTQATAIARDFTGWVAN